MIHFPYKLESESSFYSSISCGGSFTLGAILIVKIFSFEVILLIQVGCRIVLSLGIHLFFGIYLIH